MPDYLKAERCCDLVMKGGITSGILYPPAICSIAEKFYLVAIGGTSAGAIAACAAAAAEYRRRQENDGSGFELLKRLPHDLSGPGKLTGLFRPDQSTLKSYKLFLDSLSLDKKSRFARTRWKMRLGWAALRREKRLIPIIENGFGLCTGMANGNKPAPGEIEPLTEWLGKTIDHIAGKTGDDPLTFADLWNAPVPENLQNTIVGPNRRSIDLRAVTTCLSFGRPYELPFDTNIFAFDPKEWRRLFPAKVVDHLVRESKKIESDTLRRDGKIPFPSGGAIPVVVAARMSLSFPGLFTMIPLYAVNYQDENHRLMKVWFSDGGITSNLPIHRFDGLFPRWPTLGINLQYMKEDGKPARKRAAETLIYMIDRPGDGTRDLWHIFDADPSPVAALFGFAGAIFRSAQVWHDNGFLRLPGFRDRVVEIWLSQEEGGMNLEMAPSIIKGLIDRGEAAGIRLRDRFSTPHAEDEVTWDGHRWARLRSGLAGMAKCLHAFHRSVNHPMPGDRKLGDMLATRDSVPYYRFEDTQFVRATEAIRQLQRLAEEFAETPACKEPSEFGSQPFCDGPQPPIEYGSRAPM